MGKFIKTLLKAIGKYVAKYFLRRSGVFGVYGTFKSFGGFKKVIKSIGKDKTIFKVFQRIVKKNLLRNLHSANFIRDLEKYGVGESAKRVFKNRFIPLEFRKTVWFFKELRKKKSIKPTFVENKILLMGLKGVTMTKNGEIYIRGSRSIQQANLLRQLNNYVTDDKEQDKMRKDIVDAPIRFRVKSPETRNFSQYTHYYQPRNKLYYVPIRGWNGRKTKNYCYDNIEKNIVYKAISTSNYGRRVFSLFRTR